MKGRARSANSKKQCVRRDIPRLYSDVM